MAWGKGKKEKRAMPDTLAANMLAAGYEPRSMMTRRPLPYLSPEEALTHPMVQRCVAIGAIISASRPSPRFSRFESDPASPFNGSAISENVFEFRDIMPNSLNAQAGR